MGTAMAINIKDPETDRRARELAARTGETLTTAISVAISERLERLRGRRATPDLATELDAIAERSGTLPLVDRRSPEEILGYDADGLPR
jgi:antitoxin VapB